MEHQCLESVWDSFLMEMEKHYFDRASALAAEEILLQKKKDIFFNNCILNIRIKKVFHERKERKSLRKERKSLKICLKQSSQDVGKPLQNSFQFPMEAEINPEDYRFQHDTINIKQEKIKKETIKQEAEDED